MRKFVEKKISILIPTFNEENNIMMLENLRFYKPTAGDIKFLHLLVKFKLSLLIMLCCRKRFRAHRKFKES